MGVSGIRHQQEFTRYVDASRMAHSHRAFAQGSAVVMSPRTLPSRVATNSDRPYARSC